MADRRPRDAAFLSRVVVQDFKSIASCDVALGPLMFLVGRNGAGKSNFLDALHLIGDAVRLSLEAALLNQGGAQAIVRRIGSRAAGHFAVRLEFQLGEGRRGHYALRIKVKDSGAWSVADEECSLRGRRASYYRVANGRVTTTSEVFDPTTERRIPPGPAWRRLGFVDRLFLPLAAADNPDLRRIEIAFHAMGFYNFDPVVMSRPQILSSQAPLAHDGGNAASVLLRLQTASPLMTNRLQEYLTAIVPGLERVEPALLDTYGLLRFYAARPMAPEGVQFSAAEMSDGTLRVLGVLLALFQVDEGPLNPPLVAIEEPETALHPAAALALLDALREASQHRQVIITTHSTDLLRDDDLDSRALLPVVSDGVTLIGPPDQVSSSSLADHLYTAGDLLEMDQLRPTGPGPEAGLFDMRTPKALETV